ncbi:MAG: class II fructose-1,6-bisphosphate aldolase [Mycoplasmataceae bacterium]|nr:class II fructose-1,6-bisphosphate aldolase [Mycoplasmataceae bacterium]
MTKMLNDAKKGKYAIGQFNINNLEWTKSVLQAVKDNNSPAILGVSEGAAKYMGGFKTVGAMVKALMETMEVTQPVALHLDHGSSYEKCKEALDAGFTSVMIDGSEEPIEENVEITTKVVKLAKKYKASVEAEVGTVGGVEDGVVGSGVNYAKLDECKKISATGIDALAASLGSVHGHYAGEPNLGFKEMAEFSASFPQPLVLHGGSGIPADMIQKAIKSGEAKINVNTEIQEAFTASVRKYIEDKKDKELGGYDPRKVLAGAAVSMTATVTEKMKLFGSVNKA